MKSSFLHVSFQLNLGLSHIQFPRSLPRRETLARIKMAFATTALARPRWVTATESTLASPGPGPRAHAPAVPTSARVPWWVGWVAQARDQWRRRRLQSSQGSSRPRLCQRGCRGNWGPACRSTATAADAAKAVPRDHRNLLYQRVSIQHKRWQWQRVKDTTNTHTLIRILTFLTLVCLHASFFFACHLLFGHKFINQYFKMKRQKCEIKMQTSSRSYKMRNSAPCSCIISENRNIMSDLVGIKGKEHHKVIC